MNSNLTRWTRCFPEVCLAVMAPLCAFASVQDSIDTVVRNHPFLGQPTRPMTALPGGYQREYEGGVVYFDNANPAATSEVHGEILAKYLLAGGPAGSLGFPRTHQLRGARGVGAFNHFTHGSIYCFPLLGAHIVSGAARDKWVELGAEGGPLGFPTSEVQDLEPQDGSVSRFQYGAIYYSGACGAHYLYGPLLQKWNDHGAAQGSYGCPLDDPYTIGDKWYQRFEHGTLVVDGRSRDLSAEITRRGIGIRDQGNSRGTCVVFAMTFLLEYAYTEMIGGACADLSEEYLNHVANVAVGKTNDAYSFAVVAAGYDNFGIIRESGMVYSLRPPDFNAVTITPQMYDEGQCLLQDGLRLQGHAVIPRSEEGITREQFDTVLSYLARGIPVALGLGRHYLGTDGFHAMAAVGYKYDPTWEGGGYLIFKNSYGPLDAWHRESFGSIMDTTIEAYVYEQPYRVDWTPPSECAAHWKLDEGLGTTAADATGAGHTGVLRWGPTWTTGMRGSALMLDGKDDHVDCGAPQDLPAGGEPRSLCAWAKTDTTAAGSRWIAAYGTAGTGQAMSLGLRGATLVGSGYADDLSSEGFWTPGVWQHVCLTYDGTTARLYANAQQVASASKAWNLVLSRVYIGRQVDTLGESWDGAVDDVRIYRRALSPDDVRAVMDGKAVPDYAGLAVTP